MALTKPYCVFSKKAQTIATTTPGRMEGKKKMARKIERPKIRVFSKVAIRNAETSPNGTPSPT